LERLYQLYASFGEALSIIRFLLERLYQLYASFWRGFINYTLPIPIPIPFAMPLYASFGEAFHSHAPFGEALQ
jgi:hypothetical protein